MSNNTDKLVPIDRDQLIHFLRVAYHAFDQDLKTFENEFNNGGNAFATPDALNNLIELFSRYKVDAYSMLMQVERCDSVYVTND